MALATILRTLTYTKSRANITSEYDNILLWLERGASIFIPNYFNSKNLNDYDLTFASQCLDMITDYLLVAEFRLQVVLNKKHKQQV